MRGVEKGTTARVASSPTDQPSSGSAEAVKAKKLFERWARSTATGLGPGFVSDDLVVAG